MRGLRIIYLLRFVREVRGRVREDHAQGLERWSRGEYSVFTRHADLTGDKAAAILRILVVALVDLHPSNTDGRASSQSPSLLNRPQTPNALGVEIIQLGLSSDTAKLGVQGLSREVVDVLLVAVN